MYRWLRGIVFIYLTCMLHFLLILLSKFPMYFSFTYVRDTIYTRLNFSCLLGQSQLPKRDNDLSQGVKKESKEMAEIQAIFIHHLYTICELSLFDVVFSPMLQGFSPGSLVSSLRKNQHVSLSVVCIDIEN
jgi:hypothetical protein